MKITRLVLLMLAIALSSKNSVVRAQEGDTAAPSAPAAQAPAAAAPAAEVPAPAAPAAPSTDAPAAPAKNSAAPNAAAEGEYEIDYEEEPGSEGDEPEEAPAAKPARGKKTPFVPGSGSGGIMGSRAKHRFTPILKSETKSIYKKDGKSLDVDSD